MDFNLKYIHDEKINVAVVLSAYLGHKYIEPQVKSILEQEYDIAKYQLTLYIRDDSQHRDEGMNKYFTSLLSDTRVKFIDENSENIGVRKSYYELLSYVKADYYLFSDQDDIWNKNKFSIFLKNFMELDSAVPILLYSDLLLVDGDNKSLNTTMKDTVGKNRNCNSFSNRLLDDAITGASMGINRLLRDIVVNRENYFNQIVMHDSYLGIVASLSGKIAFVDQPLTRYRQHENNVVGIKSKKYSKVNPLKYFKRYKWVNQHYKQAIIAAHCVKNYNILPENQKLLDALESLHDSKRFAYKNYYELVHNARGITDKIIVSYQWLIGIKQYESNN